MADISKIQTLDGTVYDIKDDYAREHISVLTTYADTVGSATVESPITATVITAWSEGTTPSLGTAIPADDITNWSPGTVPSLGTAINADKITNWTTNTPTSFSITGEKLVITLGQAATLSYDEKTIPNVTSVGTTPTLEYTPKSIPNVTSVGTTPTITKTDVTIPNISVSPMTVITDIANSGGESYTNGDEVEY